MHFRAKKIHWLGLIALLVLPLLILPTLTFSQAQSLPASSEPDYGQQWEMMLSIISHTLIPLQERFVAQTEDFEIRARTFRDHPSADTLSQLQDAWRQTSRAWASADQTGLERSAPVRNQINKPPANVKFIEGFIADNETIDLDFVMKAGSTAKGLSAIEYLLFDPQGGNEAVLHSLVAAPRAAQRMQYLVAGVEAVYATGKQYLQQWRDLQQHYTDVNTEFDPAEIKYNTIMDLRMITNKWITSLEAVLATDLADPMGLTSGGDARPDLVEAPRSHYSTELIVAYLQGFKLVFNGISPDGSNHMGYDDGLDFMRAEFEGRPLSQVIDSQIDSVIHTLNTLDVSLEDALTERPEVIAAAHDELRTLARLVQADMTSQLSISLIYSDNDGD